MGVKLLIRFDADGECEPQVHAFNGDLDEGVLCGLRPIDDCFRIGVLKQTEAGLPSLEYTSKPVDCSHCAKILEHAKNYKKTARGFI